MSILKYFSSYEKQRWLIVSIVIVLISASWIHPIGLPVPIEPQVRELYNLVNSLPEGSVVIFQQSLAVAPIYGGELGGFTAAFGYQLFHRPPNVGKLRIILMGEDTPSVSYLPNLFSIWNIPSDYIMGTDWVFLPYIPSTTTSLAALALDMKYTGTDYYHTAPLSSMPLYTGRTTSSGTVLQPVITAADVALIVWSGSGSEWLTAWIQVWGTTYKSTIYANPAGAVGTGFTAYVPTLVKGLLNGITASAEYELVIGHPGIGGAIQTIEPLGYILILFIVLGAFIALYYSPIMKKRVKEVKEVK